MSTIDNMTTATVLPFARQAVKGVHSERAGAMTRQTFTFAALLAGWEVAIASQDQKELAALRNFYIDSGDAEIKRERRNRALVAAGFAVLEDDDANISPRSDIGFDFIKDPKKPDAKAKCPDFDKIAATVTALRAVFCWMVQIADNTIGCAGLTDTDSGLAYFKPKGKSGGQIWVRDWFLMDAETREANKDPLHTPWVVVDGGSGRGHTSFAELQKVARDAFMPKKASQSKEGASVKLTTALDSVAERAEAMIAKGEGFDPTLAAKGAKTWALLCIELGIADADGANFDADKARTMFAEFINDWAPAEKTGTDA